MNTPIYTINSKIIDLVAHIAERVGELRASGETLSLEKITDKTNN